MKLRIIGRSLWKAGPDSIPAALGLMLGVILSLTIGPTPSKRTYMLWGILFLIFIAINFCIRLVIENKKER